MCSFEKLAFSICANIVQLKLQLVFILQSLCFRFIKSKQISNSPGLEMLNHLFKFIWSKVYI